MKNIISLISLSLFCLIVSLVSCAKKDIYRGIYETTTKGHEITRDSSGPVVKESPPSYGQYQLDRKKVIEEQAE